MNLRLPCSLFFISVLTCALHAGEIPAELAALRLDYETRLAPPKAKLDGLIKARAARYASDLKNTETQVASGGQLEALVSVKAEREAYEQGNRTNGYAPGNLKIPSAARQLRAAFDADTARLRAASAPEGRALAGEYLRKLTDLERKLTTAKDVPGALAVRQEREETQLSGLDPLNPPTSGLIGTWKPSAKDANNQKRGTSIVFLRDGTWKGTENTGTWEWMDKGRRKIKFRWNEKPWIDEYTLSPDGKHLDGLDNQKSTLLMERLP